MKKTIALILSIAVVSVVFAGQEKIIATLLGDTPIMENAPAPEFPKMENNDLRRKRNYPMQAPTIPHKIDNYQIDLNSNKCMSCHSRRRVEDSQAPMVSVTHYMDRDGNFLAEVSPRRYFCNQCHVPQYDMKPAAINIFQDVDALIENARKHD